MEWLNEFSKIGKPYVILISGKAGVGKSVVANLFVEELAKLDNIRYNIIPFAQKIKESAEVYYGWNGRKDVKGRALLQDLGKVGREYWPNLWAAHVVKAIATYLPVYDFVFIDDWRFLDEFDYLSSVTDYYIKTIRVHAPGRESLRGTPEAEDVSENSLPYEVHSDIYDYVLYNDCGTTIKDLQERVHVTLHKIVESQVNQLMK